MGAQTEWNIVVNYNIKIFTGNRLYDFLEGLMQQLHRTVRSQDKNYLLNVNESDYVEYLVKQFTLQPIKLKSTEIRVSSKGKNVPIGSHAFDYGLDRSDKIKNW